MILDGAGKAFDGGWNKVKLYFMLGLPTETEDDMKDIAHLADKIARRYYEIPKDQRNGKCQITVSTSFFVPKPFTLFQWVPMNNRDEFLGKAKIVNQEVKDQLNRKSIKYNWHEADVTVLEGILARGDRRLAPAILRAYEKEHSTMPGVKISNTAAGVKHLMNFILIRLFIPSVSVPTKKSFHGISSGSALPRNFYGKNGNVPRKKK